MSYQRGRKHNICIINNKKFVSGDPEVISDREFLVNEDNGVYTCAYKDTKGELKYITDSGSSVKYKYYTFSYNLGEYLVNLTPYEILFNVSFENHTIGEIPNIVFPWGTNSHAIVTISQLIVYKSLTFVTKPFLQSVHSIAIPESILDNYITESRDKTIKDLLVENNCKEIEESDFLKYAKEIEYVEPHTF